MSHDSNCDEKLCTFPDKQTDLKYPEVVTINNEFCIYKCYWHKNFKAAQTLFTTVFSVLGYKIHLYYAWFTILSTSIIVNIFEISTCFWASNYYQIIIIGYWSFLLSLIITYICMNLYYVRFPLWGAWGEVRYKF